MSSSTKPTIRFTQEQIEWLEKEFPERSDKQPADEIQYQRGQRSVLSRIKQQCRVEQRLVPVYR
jgi:hypothetical protein